MENDEVKMRMLEVVSEENEEVQSNDLIGKDKGDQIGRELKPKSVIKQKSITRKSKKVGKKKTKTGKK